MPHISPLILQPLERPAFGIVRTPFLGDTAHPQQNIANAHSQQKQGPYPALLTHSQQDPRGIDTAPPARRCPYRALSTALASPGAFNLQQGQARHRQRPACAPLPCESSSVGGLAHLPTIGISSAAHAHTRTQARAHTHMRVARTCRYTPGFGALGYERRLERTDFVSFDEQASRKRATGRRSRKR
jgi:hypothetical protein